MGKVSGGAGRATRRGSGGGGAVTGNAAGEQAAGRLDDLPPAPATSTLVPPAAAPAQTAGFLGPSTLEQSGNERVYTFSTVDGQEVSMAIYSARNADGNNYASIDFTVGGRYSRQGTLPQEVANAVSLRLMRHMREDARTRPDGFLYQASAVSGDGYGMERATAYQVAGMSRPLHGTPSSAQYGIVENGRMRPDMARVQRAEGRMFEENNRNWAERQANLRTQRANQRADRQYGIG